MNGSKNMHVQVIGIPWYRREEYAAIRSIMADAHVLPATFDVWLAKAEQVRDGLLSQGGIAVEAHIDPERFPGWCRGRGLHVDAHARTEYANLMAFEHYQKLQM